MVSLNMSIHSLFLREPPIYTPCICTFTLQYVHLESSTLKLYRRVAIPSTYHNASEFEYDESEYVYKSM